MSASLQSPKMQRALRELKQLNEEIDSYLADMRAHEQREAELRRELISYLTGTIFDPPMPYGISDEARQILERNWREEDSPLRDVGGPWRDAGGGNRFAPATPHDVPTTFEALKNWTPSTMSANPHSSSLSGSESSMTPAAQRTRSNSESGDYDIETDTLSPSTNKSRLGFGFDSESLMSPKQLAGLNGEGAGQLSQTFMSPILKLHDLTVATPQVPPLPAPNLDQTKEIPPGDGRSVLDPPLVEWSPIPPQQTNPPEPITPPPGKVGPSMRSNYTGPSISAYNPTQTRIDIDYDNVLNKLRYYDFFKIPDKEAINRLNEQADILFPQTTQGKAIKAIKDLGGVAHEAADAWSEQRQKSRETRPTNHGNNRRFQYNERPTTIRAQPRGGGS